MIVYHDMIIFVIIHMNDIIIFVVGHMYTNSCITVCINQYIHAYYTILHSVYRKYIVIQ